MAEIIKKTFTFLVFFFAVTQYAYAAENVFETKDMVSVNLERKQQNHFILHADVKQGFHINANPATLDFLIPTEISFDGNQSNISVQYPDAHMIEGPLGKIGVYSGKIDIPFIIEGGTSTHTIKVIAQACDDKNCYPPSTWVLELENK